MSDSVVVALNHAAEIFASRPLSAGAARTYMRATRAPDEQAFIQRLFDLVAGGDHFPLPREFGFSAEPKAEQGA